MPYLENKSAFVFTRADTLILTNKENKCGTC